MTGEYDLGDRDFFGVLTHTLECKYKAHNSLFETSLGSLKVLKAPS